MEKDISIIEEKFLEYVEKYDLSNERIRLKKEHITRVATECKNIAQMLSLSEEDVYLAQVIGFFHDIGRFEQVKRFNTFIDKKSVDHGLLGCQILFEENLVEEFGIDPKYYNIIYTAIRNHNKYKIEEGLDSKTNLMCKIIRDADKLDIYRTLTFEPLTAIYGDVSDEEITQEIVEDFYNTRSIRYKYIQHPLDILIAHFVYFYDINFDYTLEKVIKENLLEKLYKRFEIQNKDSKKVIEEVYQKAQMDIKELEYVTDNQITSYIPMNFELAKEQFLEYAKNYDQTDEIVRKIRHSIRVAKLCETLCKSLYMSQEQVEVGKVVGIYHDIARFEEFKRFGKFGTNSSYDHGVEGGLILKENPQFLDIFTIDENKLSEVKVNKEKQEITYFEQVQNSIKENYIKTQIIQAIVGHNKYSLTEFEKENIFAKVIRDADKLDIFFEAENLFFEDLDDLNYGEIDNSYLEALENKQCVKIKRQDTEEKEESALRNNYENSFLKIISFVYDLNFKKSFEVLKQNNYIENIFNKFNFSPKNMEIISKQVEDVTKYIDSKCGGQY